MDPTQALPLLLPIAGGVLQFVMRQFSNVGDLWYHLVAVALGFGCYVLVTPTWLAGDWRAVVVALLAWMAVHLTSIYGGTFIASNAAKAAAGQPNANATRNLLLPLTNSK